MKLVKHTDLFNALQHQNSSFAGGPDGWLVDVEGSAGWNFSPLLQVALGRVPGQRDELQLPLGQLQVLQRQLAAEGTRAADQEDVLPKEIFLHHPTELLPKKAPSIKKSTEGF